MRFNPTEDNAAESADDPMNVGIGGGCSLIPVRIAFSENPNANWTWVEANVVRGIDWAWKNGADVLSNSWVGGAPSNAIMNALERARRSGRGGRGCVIVIAAGNDSGPVAFPANLPNVLAISASNEFDQPKPKPALMVRRGGDPILVPKWIWQHQAFTTSPLYRRSGWVESWRSSGRRLCKQL